MKIHAIQTGFVRIKGAQVEGRGHGRITRQLAIFADRNWTEWLPTYAWAIEHPEGVVVVDTGQGAHLLETGSSYHPFARWEVVFRIDPEEEIGLQLRVLGIGPRDVKRVILTHLHMDHDGGLAHFPNSEILVAAGEIRTASGWAGRIRGSSMALMVQSGTTGARRGAVWAIRSQPEIDPFRGHSRGRHAGSHCGSCLHPGSGRRHNVLSCWRYLMQ